MESNKRSETRQQRRKKQKKEKGCLWMMKGVVAFNYTYKTIRLLDIIWRFFSEF